MSVIVRHSHPPVIGPPARERRPSVLHLNRSRGRLFPAVPERLPFRQLRLRCGHSHLVARLHHSLFSAGQLPAQPRLPHINPQGIDLVFAAQLRYRQRSFGLRGEHMRGKNSARARQHYRHPTTHHGHFPFHSLPPRPHKFTSLAPLPHIRSHGSLFQGRLEGPAVGSNIETLLCLSIIRNDQNGLAAGSLKRHIRKRRRRAGTDAHLSRPHKFSKVRHRIVRQVPGHFISVHGHSPPTVKPTNRR